MPPVASVHGRPNAHQDVERAENPTSQQAANAPELRGRDLAIKELFGLQNREECIKYPGVDRFFCHLEKTCFSQFAKFDKTVWRRMGVEDEKDHSQLWQWCAHVIQTCRPSENQKNQNPTVRALATTFLSEHGKGNVIFGRLEEGVQFTIVEVLLNALCWLSAMITPVVGKQELVDVTAPNGTVKALSLTVLYNGKTTKRSVGLDSTLGEIFHGVNQAAVPTPQEEGGMDGKRLTKTTGDVLHEPCVTYASLRKYAGVRLKWVNTLSEHFSLDRDTSVLSVFRYPSVCAVRVLNPNKCQVITNITNWLLPHCDYAGPNEMETEERVCQQVMLSYRLLFGQSKESRHQLRKELAELAKLVELAEASTPVDRFLLRVIGGVRKTCKLVQSHCIRFCLGQASERVLDDELDKLAAKSMPDDLFLLQCIDEVPSSWKVWAGLASPDTPFSAAILPARYRRDDDSIKEWSTYFAWIHFSSFRWRLLAIQTFGNDHPPRGVLEYVMDPRAPMQRSAAQVSVAAVVLAILFGAVQISLSGRQLVEARS